MLYLKQQWHDSMLMNIWRDLTPFGRVFVPVFYMLTIALCIGFLITLPVVWPLCMGAERLGQTRLFRALRVFR